MVQIQIPGWLHGTTPKTLEGIRYTEAECFCSVGGFRLATISFTLSHWLNCSSVIGQDIPFL